MEYLVSYQKHIFVQPKDETDENEDEEEDGGGVGGHKVSLLFHFTISNTIEDQELR